LKNEVTSFAFKVQTLRDQKTALLEEKETLGAKVKAQAKTIDTTTE